MRLLGRPHGGEFGFDLGEYPPTRHCGPAGDIAINAWSRLLASPLVVEFWADPQCRFAGEFEVVIGADRLRWSCKTFT